METKDQRREKGNGKKRKDEHERNRGAESKPGFS